MINIREKAVQLIADEYEFYLDISNKLLKDKIKAEELLHHCIEYLYNRYNQTKIKHAIDNGYFKFWFISILKMEGWSNDSYFERDYKRYEKNKTTLNKNHSKHIYQQMDIVDDEEYAIYHTNNIRDYLNELIEKDIIKWWEVELALLYLDNDETYRSLEIKTKIPLTTIYLTVTKIKEIIIAKFKK